ncbi:hypothetical protein AB0D67_14535 [Streptosporangium sp. NPDC048047]|uniref:hypothetical protein n=1 Tax=Streptosporangium sp. NPDC048047 TaxID=3155748 RepID=UPI0034352C7F
MSDRAGVRVEVWPVTADSVGLWLISGADAWRSGPIAQDSDPHTTVETLLADHSASADVTLLHSTSWRAEDGDVILTYVAVVGCSDLAREQWPDAAPINPALPDAVGKPIPVEATEAPIPRYIDVLMHGLRHLRFLLHTDSAARSALCDRWKAHLQAFVPALAGMYDHERGEAPITLPDASLLS